MKITDSLLRFSSTRWCIGPFLWTSAHMQARESSSACALTTLALSPVTSVPAPAHLRSACLPCASDNNVSASTTSARSVFHSADVDDRGTDADSAVMATLLNTEAIQSALYERVALAQRLRLVADTLIARMQKCALSGDCATTSGVNMVHSPDRTASNCSLFGEVLSDYAEARGPSCRCCAMWRIECQNLDSERLLMSETVRQLQHGISQQRVRIELQADNLQRAKSRQGSICLSLRFLPLV